MSCRMLACIGAAVTLAAAARPALASGTPPAGAAMEVIAVPLALGATVAIGANTYYSISDIGGSWFGKIPSEQQGRREACWTAWQPAILVPASVALGTLRSWGKDQAPATVFALAVWPLSLSAHGLWYAAPDHRWAAVSLLSVGDGALILYNATMLARGVRVTQAYAVTETLVGGLQFLYGIGAAVNADGGEQSRNAALLSAPVTLLTHGLVSLTLPKKRSRAAKRNWMNYLTFVPAPAIGGMTVVASGVW